VWTNEKERPLFLLCEEDRDRYEELVEIKEDALGNVKEEDKKGETEKSEEKPYKRSGRMY
jgi:hypothetical protein